MKRYDESGVGQNKRTRVMVRMKSATASIFTLPASFSPRMFEAQKR